MNELRTKAIAGAGWTFASAVVVRLLQLLVTVILARLLVPSDFGLFALAFMVINAINVFRDYGLAQSLIYEKESVSRSADATFWMSAGFGLLAWFCIYVSSSFVGAVFARPSLVEPLKVMGLSVIVSSLAMVPNALLEKELLFRKRAVPEVANGLVYATVSIALAFDGVGVWSLVAGHIAGTTASSISAWWVAGWRPGYTFVTDSARKSLSYGRHLMIGSVMVFAFFYIDNAAIGRFLGTTSLGFYNLAFTICNLPATNITHVVNKVMFPAYTKLNHDRPAMAKAYLQTIRSISALSFPLAAGFCVFAPDFVPAFFGVKWLPTVPLFRILAFYGLYRSIGATCGSVFMASGQPQWVLRMNSLQVFIAVTLLYPVINSYGTVGVAALFTMAYVVGTTLSIWKAAQILQITFSEYVHTLKGPFLASAGAVAAAYGVSSFLQPGLVRVLCATVTAAALYVRFITVLDEHTAHFARELVGMFAERAVKARV